jgi:two-component system chemotaxis response regulator CheB
MIRVFVVDDSIFMRKVITDAVNATGDMVVVGTASDGEQVLEQVRKLRPDVISLDIEMPRKNGLIALQEVMSECPTPVVMVSTITQVGAQATMTALEIGAVDFIGKPTHITAETMQETFKDLLPKLRTAAEARLGRVKTIAARPDIKPTNTNKVLLIASSTGGPKALMTLFETLPKDMTVPCVIVQHMPAGFTKSLAQRLNGAGSFKVREAQTGDELEPGVALLAQGGQHLEFDSATRVRLHDATERQGVKPSADYLFESAANFLEGRSLGVILTGMGKDGTEGALAIKRSGGMVLGESAETCTVYGMSRAAKEAGAIAGEFPISELHLAIMAALQGGKRAAA